MSVQIFNFLVLVICKCQVLIKFDTVSCSCSQRYGLAMWRKSVIRLPVTEAKYINNCSLFILLPGVIRQLGLKPNSEQKAEDMFVMPPYCQTACWQQYLFYFFLFPMREMTKSNSVSTLLVKSFTEGVTS